MQTAQISGTDNLSMSAGCRFPPQANDWSMYSDPTAPHLVPGRRTGLGMRGPLRRDWVGVLGWQADRFADVGSFAQGLEGVADFRVGVHAPVVGLGREVAAITHGPVVSSRN